MSFEGQGVEGEFKKVEKKEQIYTFQKPFQNSNWISYMNMNIFKKSTIYISNAKIFVYDDCTNQQHIYSIDCLKSMN
mgnify:CR=1 FL=1